MTDQLDTFGLPIGLIKDMRQRVQSAWDWFDDSHQRRSKMLLGYVFFAAGKIARVGHFVLFVVGRTALAF